jgi:hypothetical protein
MRSGRVQNRNSFCRGGLFFEVLASLASGTTAVAAPQESHLYEDASGSLIVQATEQFPAALVLFSQGQSKWLTTASLLSGGHIQSAAHQRSRQLRVSHRSEKAGQGLSALPGFHGQVRLDSFWPAAIYTPCCCVA